MTYGTPLKWKKKNPSTSGSDTEEGEELCLHCDSENLLLDNGHVICRDCGTINSTSIDCNAEWRYYGNDDSKYSDPKMGVTY